MNKTQFYKECPKTRKEFVSKFRNDYIFRNWADVYGFKVIGENVIFPNGMVANSTVK